MANDPILRAFAYIEHTAANPSRWVTGGTMIPTLLVAGIIFGFLPGRWALVGVLGLGVTWTVLLLMEGEMSGPGEAISAALFGLANAAVGGSVSQLLRHAVLLLVSRSNAGRKSISR